MSYEIPRIEIQKNRGGEYRRLVEEMQREGQAALAIPRNMIGVGDLHTGGERVMEAPEFSTIRLEDMENPRYDMSEYQKMFLQGMEQRLEGEHSPDPNRLLDIGSSTIKMGINGRSIKMSEEERLVLFEIMMEKGEYQTRNTSMMIVVEHILCVLHKMEYTYRIELPHLDFQRYSPTTFGPDSVTIKRGIIKLRNKVEGNMNDDKRYSDSIRIEYFFLLRGETREWSRDF